MDVNQISMEVHLNNDTCVSLFVQPYDQELFKVALSCLSAVGGALPPDYMESKYMTMMDKQSSMDSEGNFTPQPADTAKYLYFVFLFIILNDRYI